MSHKNDEEVKEQKEIEQKKTNRTPQKTNRKIRFDAEVYHTEAYVGDQQASRRRRSPGPRAPGTLCDRRTTALIKVLAKERLPASGFSGGFFVSACRKLIRITPLS